MTLETFVDVTLNTLLLGGILITALVSVFKVGRWFEGLISSMGVLSKEMLNIQQTLDEHIDDENARFLHIEIKIDDHGKLVNQLSADVTRLHNVVSPGGKVRT